MRALTLRPLRLPRRRTVRVASAWVQALHLYSAAGIAAFGWAACDSMGWNGAPYLPLWFLGALVALNAGALRPPETTRGRMPPGLERLRWVALALAALAALLLVWLPVSSRDWLLLAFAVIAVVLSIGASLPRYRTKLSSMPFLPTFVAPTAIAIATFLPPLIEQPWSLHVGTLLFGLLWSWSVLFSYEMVCDLRDLRHDRQAGLPTLAVFMGRKRAIRMLWGLVGCTLGLATMLAMLPGATSRRVWIANALILPAYLLWMLWSSPTRRRTHTHGWWVDGVLFVPAIIRFFLR